METIEIMPDVAALPVDQLSAYALERAKIIARETQGDSWDDPEEWLGAAAELAHAVVRLSQIEAR